MILIIAIFGADISPQKFKLAHILLVKKILVSIAFYALLVAINNARSFLVYGVIYVIFLRKILPNAFHTDVGTYIVFSDMIRLSLPMYFLFNFDFLW